MLTTEKMPPQDILEKYEVLKNTSPYTVRFAEIKSTEIIPNGAWVIYAQELGNSFFQLTQVIKTDKKGIIKTTSGINFSGNKSTTYLSTQKFEGERFYCSLYWIDKAFEELQKALEKSAANDREATHRRVSNAITHLNPHSDKDIIDQLNIILKQEGKL